MPAGEPLVSSLVELPTGLPTTVRGHLFSFAAAADEQDGCRELDIEDFEEREELLADVALSFSVLFIRKEDGKRLELTQGAVVSNTRRFDDEEYYYMYEGDDGYGDDAQFVWDLCQDTATATPKLHARFEATPHFVNRKPREQIPEGLDDDALEAWDEEHQYGERPELFLAALSIRLMPTRELMGEDGYDSECGVYHHPPERTTSPSQLLKMLQAPSFATRWV